MFRRSWKTHMTDAESRRGLVFFLLYFFLFPYLNAFVQRLIFGDAETPIAEANILYYAVLFMLCLLLFWNFLKEDFLKLMDWVPENTFGVLLGLVGAGVMSALLRLLPFPVADPIPAQYVAEFGVAPIPTLVLLLLLIPVVEETLYRGLLFGQFRGYSRPLAYVLTSAFYALAAVWRYALERGDARYLLLSVVYLPLSIACTWCYDNGGSVWATAFLHAGLNGVILFLAL